MFLRPVNKQRFLLGSPWWLYMLLYVLYSVADDCLQLISASLTRKTNRYAVFHVGSCILQELQGRNQATDLFAISAGILNHGRKIMYIKIIE